MWIYLDSLKLETFAFFVTNDYGFIVCIVLEYMAILNSWLFQVLKGNSWPPSPHGHLLVVPSTIYKENVV